MIKDFTKGYIVEGRYDNHGNFGVMMNYKIHYRNNFSVINITSIVDLHGNLMVPAFLDVNNFFVPLYTICGKDTFEDDILTFIRSNRAIYGVSNAYLVVDLKLVFDKDTRVLDTTQSDFSFYVPRKVDAEGNKYLDKKKDNVKETPVLICDKLTVNDTNEQMFLLHQEKKILDSYTERVKNQLVFDNCVDRYSLVSYLVGQKDRK